MKLTPSPPYARLETLRVPYFGYGEEGLFERLGEGRGVPALKRLHFGNYPGRAGDAQRWRASPLGARLSALRCGPFEFLRSGEGALDALDALEVHANRRHGGRWPELERDLLALAAGGEPTRSVTLVSEAPLDPALVEGVRKGLPATVSLRERVAAAP